MALIPFPITLPFLFLAVTPSCNCCITPENFDIPSPEVILKSSFTPPSALIAASRTILSFFKRSSSAESLPALPLSLPRLSTPGTTPSIVVGSP